MSFNALPGEIVLHIASALHRAPLNALLQVNRSIAVLLTPELYGHEFPFDTAVSPNDLPHHIDQIDKNLPGFDPHVRVYQCAMLWQSDIILEYLRNLPDTIFKRSSRKANTILHQVAGDGNTKLFDILISKGADHNAVNVMHQTPLHIALRREDTTIISRLMQEGANATILDSLSKSVLVYAIDTGSLSVIKCVLQSLKTRGESLSSTDRSITLALSQHIVYRNWSILILLFEHGVDLSWEYSDGRSLFGDVVNIRDARFFDRFLYRCGKAIRLADWEGFLFALNPLVLSKQTISRLAEGVLALGGSFESQRSSTGESTLHKFAVTGSVSGVEVLLSLGANVLVTRDDGATPSL
ncbi:hypothetical protein ONS95_000311 [Cadophora gregata]|uniref:uncharacterized protein n=1 Tax=Cadophora gregata TaxID=51156 RepID=UPI0026DC7FFB|nr:uncharacterized protein ONS95_000311 [Cadophora gregata]KAK0125686.1 hypothetical protein ONS96_009519 [Cadophora gregata f. sp. sojae]KAK0128336.1 hypothetical protein ONS95_000311 [Cadophora gregata]